MTFRELTYRSVSQRSVFFSFFFFHFLKVLSVFISRTWRRFALRSAFNVSRRTGFLYMSNSAGRLVAVTESFFLDMFMRVQTRARIPCSNCANMVRFGIAPSLRTVPLECRNEVHALHALAFSKVVDENMCKDICRICLLSNVQRALCFRSLILNGYCCRRKRMQRV